MSAGKELVYLSPNDTERFGVTFARAWISKEGDIDEAERYCGAHGVDCLIARAYTDGIRLAQQLEHRDYFLCDTLLYYRRDFAKAPIPEDDGRATIRPVREGEAEAVRAIALDSFRGSLAHYHADPRLDPVKCDEVFEDWTYRSAKKELADEVLVAEWEGRLAGFATLRLNNAEEGEGVLFGVHPSAQRRGIYRSFMIHAMRWVLAQGAARMVVSTQVNNLGVQKAWVRLGFEPDHSYYTFHKWFS